MFTRLSYKERAKGCPSPLAKQLFQLLDDKKTNLALAADVTQAEHLLQLADQLGPYICLLKTHIDIIEDFTPHLIEKLQKLSNQHQFLLFEDRKFADIGNTVLHQYQGGIYQIANWAHLINAHSLPGPGIIQGLEEIGRQKNRGLFLIAEMSSKGHLMDLDYQKNTLAMAEQYTDFVIDFITQHALSSHPNWINLSPGIQLEINHDMLGQQYVTPEKAILEQETDIIIVGRGIVASKNPLFSTQQYRKAGWDAYSKRCQTLV